MGTCDLGLVVFAFGLLFFGLFMFLLCLGLLLFCWVCFFGFI